MIDARVRGVTSVDKKSSLSKCLLLLFLLFVYVGLPILILMGVIPFDYKFYVLTIGAILVYVAARIFGLKNDAIGITNQHTKLSIVSVLPVTIVFVLSGIAIWALGYSRISPDETWGFYLFYIFISSPVQEFLYRGALPAFLEEWRVGNKLVCIISTFLYSFVHIIYKDWLTLLLTFGIGLIWFFCYRKSKNLLGVSVSHAILGAVTIIAGIID